jgi:hypothetical protein
MAVWSPSHSSEADRAEVMGKFVVMRLTVMICEGLIRGGTPIG